MADVKARVYVRANTLKFVFLHNLKSLIFYMLTEMLKTYVYHCLSLVLSCLKSIQNLNIYMLIIE